MSRICLLILGALFALSTACATPPQPPPKASNWADNRLADRASKLADRHVELIAGDRWQHAEIDAIDDALDALPALFLPTANYPLRIARIDRACQLGMGRYNETCPTFADDGTLLLYDVAIQHHRDSPTQRLAMLSRADGQRLLRMRAVAHALAVRADRRHRWSDSDPWRRLNGWDGAGYSAHNQHQGGYLRPLGQRSAHLDLVTSLEAFLVREEDIHRRAAAENYDDGPRPASFDPNLTFSCQEFTRSRLIDDFLSAVDDQWRQNSWRHHRQSPPLDCPAFESWADFDQVAGIDILFASEQTSRPESLFGHLLLHIRHDDERRFRSEGFEYVYQFGAVTDPNINPINYLIQGMTGNFLAIFDLSTFRGIDYNYLQLEQRTLRRYALNLSDAQLRQALERVWEAERHVAYPYYFTTHNCASMLLDLLSPVLARDQQFARRPVAMPTEVLDLMAELPGANDQPLLARRPDDVLSAADRALAATQLQRQMMRSLPKNTDNELLQALQSIPDANPAERRRIYETLSGLLDDAVDAQALSESDAWALSESFIDGERARLERANAQLLEFHDRALTVDLAIPVNEVFEMRRHHYRDEDLARRSREKNEFSRQRFYLFRDAPRRPPSRRELRLHEHRDQLDQAYDAAAASQADLATLLRRRNPDFRPLNAHDAQRQARRQAQRELDDRSLVPSNSNRLRLGVQASTGPPRAHIQFALLDDQLGQRRRHGHRPEIEAVVLASRLSAPLRADFYRDLALDMVLFRYLTLASRPGTLGNSLFDRLGWGTDLSARVRPGALPLQTQAFFGVFSPLVQSASAVNHLALGLGPTLAAGVGRRQNSMAAGLQGHLRARKHLAGSYDNALTFRLSHAEGIDPFGLHWRRQTRARLALDIALPLADHALIVSPHVDGEYNQFHRPRADADHQLRLGLTLEPLWGARP